jgi:hypothetical protein
MSAEPENEIIANSAARATIGPSDIMTEVPRLATGPGNRRWGSLSTVGGNVGPALISEDLAPEDAYSRLERLDRETFKCNMAL